MLVSSTDGVRLAVHDLTGPEWATDGPDEAVADDGRPPLLLSHATGLHGRVYQPLADVLRPHFHCWALDYRGHGNSPQPMSGRAEWAAFTEDAVAVSIALGLEGAIGFGHSMGGTALLMAQIARPTTFAGIVVYEPISASRDAGGDTVASTMLASGARRRRPGFPSRDEAFANYAGKPPLATFSPASLRAYVDHGFDDEPDGSVRLKCTPAWEATVFEAGGREQSFRQLADVDCPVLVLSGPATGGNMAASYAPLVAEALPHSRFRQMDHLTHMGPLQDPELVGRAILDFVAGIDAAR
jgi:pimeloyl-ACP methyl ester carboxylesterase